MPEQGSFFTHGSRWVRADFHLHTRRDRDEFSLFSPPHNANFPVLGDAEQVGACSFAAGHGDVKVGSIDDPGIQKAIVSIMEGGHEAFARRKEIYQLWKQ